MVSEILVSKGIEPVLPVVEVQSLNHWTAREVPNILFFFFNVSFGVRSSALGRSFINRC